MFHAEDIMMRLANAEFPYVTGCAIRGDHVDVKYTDMDIVCPMTGEIAAEHFAFTASHYEHSVEIDGIDYDVEHISMKAISFIVWERRHYTEALIDAYATLKVAIECERMLRWACAHHPVETRIGSDKAMEFYHNYNGETFHFVIPINRQISAIIDYNHPEYTYTIEPNIMYSICENM